MLKAKKRPGGSTTPSKSDRRRVAIVAALRQCMLTKGYAETSLTDLARVANMTVSHLLYYFPSREAVLLALCDEVLEKIEQDVIARPGAEPAVRIAALVDNVFIEGALSRSELGIVNQLVALAVHRPLIRAKLRRYNKTMMAYLEELFAESPRQPGYSAVDAAEVAAAMWMGLVNNVAYDPKLDEARARRIFAQTLNFLAGLGDAAADARKSGRSPASVRLPKRAAA